MSAMRQRGYSLIELMVSILISLILLAGLVTLFANNSRERDEIQRANQQTENGQYALEVIGDDLREAGYLSSFDPSALGTPTSDPDPCLTDAASLNAAIPIFVQGYYNYGNAGPTLSCLLNADVKAGSTVLVIRRAGACAVAGSVTPADPSCVAPTETAGYMYFQASGCSNSSELGSGSISTYYVLATSGFNLHTTDCATTAPIYPYEVHIYFIANDDKTGDGIPTLKRIDLANGAFTAPMAIAEGIDQLNIDFGLDDASNPPTSLTGAPVAFTADPYNYNACSSGWTTPVNCLNYWRYTVAAQVYVLARNLTQTPGYNSTNAPPAKSYYLGFDASSPPALLGGTCDAGYKCHVYEAEFRLKNISGRNTP